MLPQEETFPIGIATINANNFNVTAYYFDNERDATINANNFNVTAYYFDNERDATINANNFNVTADSFTNVTIECG